MSEYSKLHCHHNGKVRSIVSLSDIEGLDDNDGYKLEVSCIARKKELQ